jgi:hypothetical protein
MTGFLDFAPNPLSAITLASMEDLGYTVDPAAADPFVLGTAPFPATSRIRLTGDLLRLPPHRLSRNAKIRPPFRPGPN